MTIDIIGAGLAGLLAGNMLSHRHPIISEAQPTLPNNHSAVLRFKTSSVGDVLNIPFRKVTMVKTALPWLNPVADALAYSRKNTGISRSDRSIIAGTVTEPRWIAPPNLIWLMAERLTISYSQSFLFKDKERGENWRPTISTIPMPTLMKLLNYPKADQFKFSGTAGMNIKARLFNCDAYISLLVPDENYIFSRISVTGDEMIVECPVAEDIYGDILNIAIDAAELLGLEVDGKTLSHHQQKYAKINPLEDDEARKDFIYWATDQHGIFSLGRFATWRPHLLLDDLVQDIRLIDKWIEKKDRYAIARSR